MSSRLFAAVGKRRESAGRVGLAQCLGECPLLAEIGHLTGGQPGRLIRTQVCCAAPLLPRIGESSIGIVGPGVTELE